MYEDGKKIMDLITIITPNYNSSSLYETLDSVLTQTYSNIEYIIIDDGSLNFSEEKVRKYVLKRGDHVKRLQIVVNKKNIGTVKTMNKAYALSHGKYIFNIASDDVFQDDNVITEWVEFFEKTGADIVTAYRDVYDSNMKKVIKKSPQLEQVNMIKNFTSYQLFEALSTSNFILGCCTARSRKSFEIWGMPDEKYRVIEDYPMYLSFLRRGGKLFFWDRTVIKYRSGGISSARSFSRKYEKEHDLIFYTEVYPYVIYPKIAEIRYLWWKFRHKRYSAYIGFVEKGERNCFWRIATIITFPEKILIRIYNNKKGKGKDEG